MKSENQICRLCLNACDIFETITETTRETLNKLHLEIDLGKTENPFMCEKCSEAIQKWLAFKSYLQTQAYADKEQNLDKVCSNKNECSRYNFCGLCMKIVTSTDYFLSLATEQKHATSVNIILLKYFDEININRIKNPVICASCLESLEGCSSFVTTCLNSEEKIEKYFKDNEIDSKERIELCCVLESNFSSLNRIKAEEKYSTVKDTPYDNVSLNIDTTLKLEDNKIDIKYENFSEPEFEDQKIDMKYEDVEEQSPQENALTQSLYNCEVCNYRTKHRSRIEQHKAIHLGMDQIKMHKCDICEYQTKIQNHLYRHMIIHMSSSEVTMHKCTECSFETKWKHCLSKHMIVHKSKSEVTLHKCTLCGFETKRKCSLIKHMIVHKSSFEVTMHKCTECSFETKYENSLRNHMQIHKSANELTVYKCRLCDHQTRNKRYLRMHELKHTRSSKVTMRKCAECDFETKYQSSLKTHMLIHKKVDETTMYKCVTTEASLEDSNRR